MGQAFSTSFQAQAARQREELEEAEVPAHTSGASGESECTVRSLPPRLTAPLVLGFGGYGAEVPEEPPSRPSSVLMPKASWAEPLSLHAVWQQAEEPRHELRRQGARRLGAADGLVLDAGLVASAGVVFASGGRGRPECDLLAAEPTGEPPWVLPPPATPPPSLGAKWRAPAGGLRRHPWSREAALQQGLDPRVADSLMASRRSLSVGADGDSGEMPASSALVGDAPRGQGGGGGGGRGRGRGRLVLSRSAAELPSSLLHRLPPAPTGGSSEAAVVETVALMSRLQAE